MLLFLATQGQRLPGAAGICALDPQVPSRGGTGQDICGPNRYRVIQAEALH